jgi:hypothetical protein
VSARAVVLVPADPRALGDLATFVARAGRADPGGAARLLAHGTVLAVSVSPLHGPGLPVVLGLRALALASPSRVDTTVALAALAERLARSTDALPLPPVEVLTASWAGVSPPRSGWSPLPPVPAALLRERAAAGLARVAAGEARTAVWTEPLPGTTGATSALAWAAQVLGFLGPERAGAGDAEVAVARSGPWVRLSTPRGHVVARPPLLG